jgi:hypothetical protein
MSYIGYFVLGKILFGILKEAIVLKATDAAQQEQVQNGVQCSVSWLCLSWLIGAEIVASAFIVHSSLSPQGKQDSPNK